MLSKDKSLKSAHAREQTTGFTLLEIMIALTVLAVSGLAVFRLQSQSIELASRVEFEWVAPMIAERQLALIETVPVGTKVSRHGYETIRGRDYPWRVNIQPMVEKKDKNGRYKIEKVGIEIQGKGAATSYRLIHYRCIPLQIP